MGLIINPYSFVYETLPPVSGYIGWWDSSKLSTITKDGGDLVSQWDDRSGNGNHLTQATGASKPLWVNSVYNGKATIRFDGDDDTITRTTFTQGTLSLPVMIFTMIEYPTTQPDTIFSSASGSPLSMNVQRSGGINYMYSGSWVDVGAVTTGFAQFTHLFNNTTSAVRRNGANINTGLNTGNNSVIGLSLASQTTSANFADTDICEVLIYNSNLSNDDRNLVEAYLTAKWVA